MRLRLKYLIPILLFCGMTACKKFVDTDPPETQIQTTEIFSNDAGALSALSGLYSQLMQTSLNFANGGITVYTGLLADEIYNTAASADYDVYKNNSITAAGTVSTRFWTPVYKTIYQCNALLDGLQHSTGMTDSTERQIYGEALLARSFVYFNLVNLFGPVPLQLTTDYRINTVMPRATTDAIYEQVIKDLLEAQALLPERYPSAGRVRPNKWTATALLARVYLYRKDWVHAEAQASTVINSGVYNLVATASIAQTFRAASTEAIWQLMPVISTLNTAEGSVFIPSSASVIPTFALQPSLLNAFEPGDKRRQSWVGSNSIGTPAVTYYYPYKYQTRSTPAGTENYIVLRLAEQYLIRAEARAQLNLLAEAAADLNTIRSRAGLGATAAASQSSLLAATEQERQVELFAEWGHRWFDLKRTNRADAVLGSAKFPNWQSTDALFPIPQTDLDRNPFLTQNPGY